MKHNLALFDLDNTLLAGDSDYLWGRFLAEEGVVDRIEYERNNARFYADYKAGTLDVRAFLRFALAPLVQLERGFLEGLRQRFLQQCIEPIILSSGRELLAEHRARGDKLVIITATNSFVTGPIAAALGVEQILATKPEELEGRYTGEVEGIPCFREGKVECLKRWISHPEQVQSGISLKGSYFYSDSHNDLPLLETVDHPVAVDPDPVLATVARARGWKIISLRVTPFSR